MFYLFIRSGYVEIERETKKERTKKIFFNEDTV